MTNRAENTGVSIIILTRNGAYHLEHMFESFFAYNTYQPLEFIIVDHASIDNTAEVINKYSSFAHIFHIKRNRNYSFAASNNYAASKAIYPYLLFLNNDIIFTADAIGPVVEKLADPEVGLVGIRLDHEPLCLPPGEPHGVQHAGVTFDWDNQKQFYRPNEIRFKTRAEAEKITSGFYPAVTGAFMICRKDDFEVLGGFCEEYDYCYEDIDFCLLMQSKLKKKCYCLNDISLEHKEGATRKKDNNEIKQRRKNHNDAVFKKRMSGIIKKVIEA